MKKLEVEQAKVDAKREARQERERRKAEEHRRNTELAQRRSDQEHERELERMRLRYRATHGPFPSLLPSAPVASPAPTSVGMPVAGPSSMVLGNSGTRNFDISEDPFGLGLSGGNGVNMAAGEGTHFRNADSFNGL